MKKERIERIENPSGYVTAEGENLYDGDGRRLTLRGVNIGDWFVQEFWMSTFSVGEFDGGVYTLKRGREAMKANPLLSAEQAKKLEKLYIDTYITEEDFVNISSLGLNCVRIPFTYFNLTEEDGTTLRENAFAKLDWAVDMCEKHGLYVILDLHGAKGSQNMDHHSGDDSSFDLYGNRKNMDATVFLWKSIAEHFKDRKTVCGYDLLNEPRRGIGKFGGKVQFDFYDELYRAVRSVDKNHMIFMECFTFPVHGVSPKKYGWKNVCYEYHIYNLTPFSQKVCNKFYKALHDLKGYKVPVTIGEWNAWENGKDWSDSIDYFNSIGWSYISWTYKTNAYMYEQVYRNHNTWGIYELRYPAVDVSKATYDEIAATIMKSKTEYAEKSIIYGVYLEKFKKNK